MLRSGTYGSGGLVGERSYAEAVQEGTCFGAQVEAQQGVDTGDEKYATSSPESLVQQERISEGIEVGQKEGCGVKAQVVIEAQNISCIVGRAAMGPDSFGVGGSVDHGSIVNIQGPIYECVLTVSGPIDANIPQQMDLESECLGSKLRGLNSEQQLVRDFNVSKAGVRSRLSKDLVLSPQESNMVLSVSTLCDVTITMVDEWDYAVQDLDLNAGHLLLEKTPNEVASTVWQLGLELGISGSKDELVMLKRLEEMETRNRLAIGRNALAR
ncbi:putative F420-0 ABC transporter substrate-binding protein [Sesbania bispinosa]|nr:putative F420-0 ABC transporter substrate-binding protein [Sesbania bispinosa]